MGMSWLVWLNLDPLLILSVLCSFSCAIRWSAFQKHFAAKQWTGLDLDEYCLYVGSWN